MGFLDSMDKTFLTILSVFGYVAMGFMILVFFGGFALVSLVLSIFFPHILIPTFASGITFAILEYAQSTRHVSDFAAHLMDPAERPWLLLPLGYMTLFAVLFLARRQYSRVANEYILSLLLIATLLRMLPWFSITWYDEGAPIPKKEAPQSANGDGLPVSVSVPGQLIASVVECVFLIGMLFFYRSATNLALDDWGFLRAVTRKPKKTESEESAGLILADLNGREDGTTAGTAADSDGTQAPGKKAAHNSRPCGPWTWQGEVRILSVYVSVTSGIRCYYVRRAEDGRPREGDAITTEEMMVFVLAGMCGLYYAVSWVVSWRSRARKAKETTIG